MSDTDTNPFIEAVKAGNIAECRRLIESQEADIHQKDSYGQSAITWGSLKGNLEIVDLLVSEIANIHDKDDIGRSPVIVASYNGHCSVIELLLSKGADIHDKDINGDSPILIASCHGESSVVDLLLSEGASLQDTDIDGYTCFTWARYPDYNPYPYRKHGLLYHLRKWPTTMAILVLTELALYHQVETDSLIDLHHFLGILADDDEENFILDREEDTLEEDEDKDRAIIMTESED